MLKKISIFLILGVMVSFVVNRLYESYFRPDSLFFSECLRKSKEWEKNIRAKAGSCYIFCGGSEVRMGIDPAIMNEKHGIATINAGVQAGNGIRCNIQSALPFIKNGDTLVISGPISPCELKEYGCTHSGVNFCFTHQGIEVFRNGILPSSFIDTLFQGDSVTYCIHIMRILTRPECIYRYSSPHNAKITESGRVEVMMTIEQDRGNPDPAQYKHITFKGWKELIDDLKVQCEKRGARLVMYIPRAYVHKNIRKGAAKSALYFTQLGVPVIQDPYLGSWEDKKAFSDTPLHLSIEGGKCLSDFLAKQLKNGRFWTERELINIINSP